MPYIPEATREDLDPQIDALIDAFDQVPFDKRGGALNYTIARLTMNVLKPEAGWSYHSLAAALSHIHEAEEEIRRRALGPYEDQCVTKNGDLREFEEFGR